MSMFRNTNGAIVPWRVALALLVGAALVYGFWFVFRLPDCQGGCMLRHMAFSTSRTTEAIEEHFRKTGKLESIDKQFTGPRGPFISAGYVTGTGTLVAINFYEEVALILDPMVSDGKITWNCILFAR